MPRRRRQVVRSARFVAKAQQRFPLGGSAEGNASFELFEERPLRAVEDALAENFEAHPEAHPGIRVSETHGLPFFPPMEFYARLLDDDHRGARRFRGRRGLLDPHRW